MFSFLFCLQALTDVHEQRSHRDIKAGNVIVSGWGSGNELKIHLIDWANSRLHEEGKPTSAPFPALRLLPSLELLNQDTAEHEHNAA